MCGRRWVSSFNFINALMDYNEKVESNLNKFKIRFATQISAQVAYTICSTENLLAEIFIDLKLAKQLCECGS